MLATARHLVCGRDTTNCYGGRQHVRSPPLRSPASELRRGQIAFRAIKFRNGFAAGPHPYGPARAREAPSPVLERQLQI